MDKKKTMKYVEVTLEVLTEMVRRADKQIDTNPKLIRYNSAMTLVNAGTFMHKHSKKRCRLNFDGDSNEFFVDMFRLGFRVINNEFENFTN